MSSMTIFILIICGITLLLLLINLLFAPHSPYKEKNSAFECGFHSFIQTRLPFNITFYIYGLLFLLFDLEIFLIFPYALSLYNNEIYGLIITLIFLFLITFGFIFELGKGALNIYTKQSKPLKIEQNFINISYLNKKIFK